MQKSLGVPTPGVHTFTITANITHVGKAAGAARYNTEFKRWVPELQLEHLLAVKRAIAAFPGVPLGPKHPLKHQAHPLADWQPVMPAVAANRRGPDEPAVADGDSDDDDDCDDDDVGDFVSVSDDDAGGTSDECPCVGCDPQCS